MQHPYENGSAFSPFDAWIDKLTAAERESRQPGGNAEESGGPHEIRVRGNPPLERTPMSVGQESLDRVLGH